MVPTLQINKDTGRILCYLFFSLKEQKNTWLNAVLFRNKNLPMGERRMQKGRQIENRKENVDSVANWKHLENFTYFRTVLESSV